MQHENNKVITAEDRNRINNRRSRRAGLYPQGRRQRSVRRAMDRIKDKVNE